MLSQRGAEGGYRLGQPANEITLADVIRVVDGPLANVRGLRPGALEYIGPATSLLQVWIALRANMRAVLERVTLEDLVTGNLPPEVIELTEAPRTPGVDARRAQRAVTRRPAPAPTPVQTPRRPRSSAG